MEGKSRFEDILTNIRNVLMESEEFKGVPVYYDDSEMNPNISLPAISFKVGEKAVIFSNANCVDYKREVEIRLHTKTLDKRKLQSELYKYEEELVTVINNAANRNEFDGFEITETKSMPICALMFNARKEASRVSDTFFSNLLSVLFVISYSI